MSLWLRHIFFQFGQYVLLLKKYIHCEWFILSFSGCIHPMEKYSESTACPQRLKLFKLCVCVCVLTLWSDEPIHLEIFK